MLEKLSAFFKREKALLNATQIASSISNLIQSMEANALKDASYKDAAIDTLIEFLQAHKNSSTPQQGS